MRASNYHATDVIQIRPANHATEMQAQAVRTIASMPIFCTRLRVLIIM